MREERDKVETVPVEGETRRPRRSRSREAFRQRQKELAEMNKGLNQKNGADQGPDNGETAAADRGPDNGEAAADRGPRVSGRFLSWKAGAAVLVLIMAVLAGGYVYKALGYRDTYLPHTVINGMDVSGKTPGEVKDMISSGVKDYRLVLKLRGDGSEGISGDSIGLHTKFDGSLEEIIRQQNPYAWPRYLLKGPSYDIQTMIAYDEGLLDQTLEGLNCFDESQVVLPADAYLSDYVKGQGYSIVQETEGNALDKDKVRAEVTRSVSDLSTELDLDALGCYRAPRVRADNTSLVSARDARNRYANITVTYTFGNNTEVLDGEEIHQWFMVDGESVTIDPDQAAAYVKGLASRHNTAYTKRTFETSYGQSVELTGFYGWRINQAEETRTLLDDLEGGESITREPVYSQTAASHDGPDYGNTYAEVNLTAQHLIFYKEGKKILESDFVSGNISKGHTTPPGIFSLTYKQKDAVLKGEGYASPVKFWMPFNGGIGFHDASWRSSFGGSIYKSGGSHGCVNMPYESARQLFENVYKGMPVICYDLPGTESGKSSQAPGRAPQAAPAQPSPAPAAPAQPAPAPTEPAQIQENPAVTPPAETPPAETTPQPSQPQVIIQPADQTTKAPQESVPGPGSTAGYGPGFQSPQASDDIGPGVD